MLKFIRQAQDNVLIKLFLLAVAASFFVGFLVLPAARQGGAEDVVAIVGEQRLYRRDVANEIVRIRNVYRERAGEAYEQLREYFEKRIPEEAFNQLLDANATEQYARSLGFGTSKEELRRVILEGQMFQVDGKFSKRAYERFLTANRMTDTQYERELSRDLSLQKFQRFLASQIKVSDAEVEQRFVDENTKIEIEAFSVTSADLVAGINVTEEEVSAYYADHAPDYMQPEQRKLRYIIYDGMGAPYLGMQAANDLADSEVEAAWKADEKFVLKEKSWRVAQIKYSFAKKGDQDSRPDEARKEDARKRATAALTKIKAGSDFVTLGTSDTDDTAAQMALKAGADNPLLIQGGYAPAGFHLKPLADAYMAMKPGDVSEIIEAGDALYLIKLLKVYEAGQRKDLEDVINEVKTTLRRDKAGKLAQADAEAHYAVSGSTSLDDLAAKREGLAVRDATIARDAVLPGVGCDEILKGKIFDELTTESGPILHQSNRSWVIVDLDAVIDPQPKPLSEVRGQIEDALKQEKATGIARETLEKVRAEVMAGASGAQISKKHKDVIVTDIPAFSRIAREKVGEESTIDTVPQLGKSAKMKATLFSLKQGEVTPEVYEVGGKVAFALVKKRIEPDASLFETQTDAIRSKLRNERFEGIYREWTQRARESVNVEVKIPIEEIAASLGISTAQS